MWQSNFKEEVMRAFVAYLLALGLVAAPAMAATGSAGDKDKDNTAAKSSSTAASDNSTATDKDKDASASTSKSEPATPGKTAASSGLESELQQLRELLEAQSRQIQIQNEQMREQQDRMEAMETELKVATTPRDTSYAPAPDSRVPKTADGSASAPRSRFADFSIGTADGQAADAENNPIAIRYKGITITPGGFLAGETIFRNKAEAADIDTGFNQIPLPGNSGSQTTEFNATGRQSQLTMLAEGKLASVKLTGYVETDFLGTGISSNNNESNSYVLRLRQGYGQAKADNGWTITGGQMWSLATETKKGVDNRSEARPMTIDPQYTVGFSWARQFGLRVSKNIGMLTLAASVENAATTLTVHGNPTSTIPASSIVTVNGVEVPTLSTTVFNNFLVGAPGLTQGLYNQTGTYAYNNTPDFLFKATLDPKFGHFEAFGIVSEFRDRIFPCFQANGAITITLAGDGTTPFPTVAIPANPCALTGSTNAASGAFNDSRTGGGIGANGRVSLGKHLDVGLHFLGGDGIGRYGTAGLPDSTVRVDGTMALIRSYQGLGTLEFHATSKLDIYAYVGGEYAGRTTFNSGKEGYGGFARRDDGCAVETLPLSAPAAAINTTAVLGSNGFIPGALSNCDGDTRNIFEGTLGFWYRFYNGPKGRFQYGVQYSYVQRNTWSGVNAAGDGVAPHGLSNMVFTSMRYYLP
jgi:hypothetical protein